MNAKWKVGMNSMRNFRKKQLDDIFEELQKVDFDAPLRKPAPAITSSEFQVWINFLASKPKTELPTAKRARDQQDSNIGKNLLEGLEDFLDDLDDFVPAKKQ